jgi:MFS family permease
MLKWQSFTRSKYYKYYVLFMLLLVGIFAWVDRQIFAMLMQSIKTEFTLSDTQLGILGGVAFSLFYVTVGLPVAWLGDRFNRRNIISAALAFWSLMTALCGMAAGFISLFFARMGVGIGEAGGSPPSQSLISDYFAPEERGFALSVFFLYIPLGFVVGYLAGGWINEFLNWRTAFFLFGLPGIALALVVRFTVKEMGRGQSENLVHPSVSGSMFSTMKQFLRRKSMVHLAVGGAIHGIGAFAVSVWAPTFFMRVHALSSSDVGTWMAVAFGLGGGLGTIAGGRLSDYLFRRTKDLRWYTRIASIATFSTIPFVFPVYLLSKPEYAFFFLTIALFFNHMFLGPVLSMVQALAGVHRRTQAAAFYLFLASLISMSLGPLTVGVVSDYYDESFEALRYVILVLAISSGFWAAIHFYLASGTLKKDLLMEDR